MLKDTVTFKNPFTDEETTRDLYFNLSEAEIIEILVMEDNFVSELETITQESPLRDILAAVKKLIARSYGERIGDDFIKTEESTAHFMGSEAYAKFLFGLFSDPSKAANFVEQVMPADLIARAKKEGKMPNFRDHMPKQNKPGNVFDHGDLGGYEGPSQLEKDADDIETAAVLDAELDLDGESKDAMVQREKAQPEKLDPMSVQVYEKLQSGQPLNPAERDWVLANQPKH